MRYEMVAVYEGTTLLSLVSNNYKTAKKIVKEDMLPLMQRKEPTSDAFIEIRRLGKFEHGDFESVENWWPDDIWNDSEFFDG